MVRRRLASLGFPDRDGGGNHGHVPGTPRTATANGGTSGVGDSVGNGNNDHDSTGGSNGGGSSSGAGICLGKGAGSGGGGRAQALARSCLALSVARQADLWPVLRTLSEKKIKHRSGSGTAARALPVLYVAGELDGRYGGRSRSRLAAAGAAAADAVKAADDARVVGVSVVRSNGAAEGKSGVSGAGNGSITTGIHSRGSHAAPTEDTVGAGSGGVGATAAETKTVGDVIAATCPGVGVTVLPGCGHAVPAEAPAALLAEVSKLSATAAAASAATCGASPAAAGGACTPAAAAAAAAAEKTDGATIVGFSLEEFSIPMTAPLQLSLCRLTDRRGVLVRLEGALPPRSSAAAGEGRDRGARHSEENGRRVWGVGEVTPLPGEQATPRVVGWLVGALAGKILASTYHTFSSKAQGRLPSRVFVVVGTHRSARRRHDPQGPMNYVCLSCLVCPSPPTSPPPLRRPGFHQETLDEAIVQLHTVLPLLVGRSTSIDLAALGTAADNGGSAGLDAWLDAALAASYFAARGPGLGDGNDGGVGVGGGCVAVGHESSKDDRLPPVPRVTAAAAAAAAATAPAVPNGAAPGAPTPAPTSTSTPTPSRTQTSTSASMSTSTTLLPSVRCGIEMALVHLVARAAGISIGAAISSASGLPCRSSIEINGLAARGERLTARGREVRGARVEVLRFVFFLFMGRGGFVWPSF